jgi:hypothetical protein
MLRSRSPPPRWCTTIGSPASWIRFPRAPSRLPRTSSAVRTWSMSEGACASSDAPAPATSCSNARHPDLSPSLSAQRACGVGSHHDGGSRCPPAGARCNRLRAALAIALAPLPNLTLLASCTDPARPGPCGWTGCPREYLGPIGGMARAEVATGRGGRAVAHHRLIVTRSAPAAASSEARRGGGRTAGSGQQRRQRANLKSTACCSSSFKTRFGSLRTAMSKKRSTRIASAG